MSKTHTKHNISQPPKRSLATPLKTKKPRVVSVPVVDLLDVNVEPSDRALRALMSQVNQTVVASNSDNALKLDRELRQAVTSSLMRFGFL